MDGYLLSYNPNDFFWVSVKNEFDFSQCPQILQKEAAPTVPAGLDASAAAAGCPVVTCPAQTPPTPPSLDWENTWNTWQSKETVPSTTTPPATVNASYLFNRLYRNASNTRNTALAAPIMDSSAVLKSSFAAELCKNHQESQKLLNIQNNVSTTQVLFSNSNDQASTLIQSIANVCVGIVAIIIVGGVAARSE